LAWLSGQLLPGVVAGTGVASLNEVHRALQEGKIRAKYAVTLLVFCLMLPLADQIARAETRIFKAVFPNTTNHYDTLFGGATLMMMDEVAFITATRFSRLKMVTVSSDRVDFTHPIPGGTLVELIGNVVRVGTTSLQVRVELFVEQMYSDERLLAVTGSFTFVAVDERRRPTPLRPAEVAQ
jgi:acyl-CoA hydrolase